MNKHDTILKNKNGTGTGGLTQKPCCPFCGLPVERPVEPAVRRPGDMPLGMCKCGAVYAYDASGKNLGAAFIESLVFSCNMDWDLAWGLLPEEDYLQAVVENYDRETNLVVPGGSLVGRRIPGALYFIRLHQDVREVTEEGAREKIARGRTTEPARGQRDEFDDIARLDKGEVEKLVREYRFAPVLRAAGRDKKIIRYLQRLLYDGEELTRLRAAEVLGMVAAGESDKSPGNVSKLLQGLFNSVADSAASSWGAVDAIGEIISRAPQIFAGYIPALFQFLEDGALRPGVLLALGRIAAIRPDLVPKRASFFTRFLTAADPRVRGYAAWILFSLGAGEKDRLRDDHGEVMFYSNGEMEKKTVAQLAAGED